MSHYSEYIGPGKDLWKLPIFVSRFFLWSSLTRTNNTELSRVDFSGFVPGSYGKLDDGLDSPFV